MFGQTISIRQARMLPVGTNTTITGIITTPNYSSTGLQFFMQDDSAGINVFSSTVLNFENYAESGPKPLMLISVEGQIAEYHGLIEIIPSYMRVIDTNMFYYPDPIWAEGNQFTTDSPLQGMRVTMTNVTLSEPFYASPTAYNIAALDEFGYPIEIRVNKGGDLSNIPPEGLKFHMTGVMGAYDNGQLNLFNLSDVEPLTTDTNMVYHDVTFAVDLNLAIEYQQFNPSVNEAYISGSFNGWGFDLLEDDNSDGIYQITMPLQAGYYEYKFFAPGMEISWEDDPNRSVYVDSSMYLYDQFRATFRDLRNLNMYDYELVFKVDMTQLYNAGRFNPNDVFTLMKAPAVSGNFSGWDVINGEQYLSLEQDSLNPMIYTMVFDVPNVAVPSELYYKFVYADYMNPTKPFITEWEAGLNRPIWVSGEEPENEFGKRVLYVNPEPEFFQVEDDTSTTVADYELYFQVDMTEMYNQGRFNLDGFFNQKTVPSVVGMHSGWGLMTGNSVVNIHKDSLNPMLFTLIYDVPGLMIPYGYEYKFVLANYTNPNEPYIVDWESGENRHFNVSGDEYVNGNNKHVLVVNPWYELYRMEQQPQYNFKIWLKADKGFKGDTVNVYLWAATHSGEPIEAVEIKLGFDYNLEFISVDNENTFGYNYSWALESNFNPNDYIVNVATTGTVAITDSAAIARFRFVIHDDYSPFYWLNPMYPVINEYEGWNIWVEPSSVEVFQTSIYQPGDVTMNGSVRAQDAGEILKYLAGYTELNEVQMILANVSSDEEVTAYDASLILQYVVGKIYELPYYEMPLKVSGMATMKRNLEMAEEMITVPISIKTDHELFAFSVTVTFDTEYLTYKSMILPEALNGFSVEVNADAGMIRIVGASSTGVVLSADDLIIEFEQAAEIPAEGTNVVLSSLRLNEEETIQSVDSSIITPIVSGIADSESIPSTYKLYQNYPNPFNPSTTIRYDLPESGEVLLTVFDITGRKVATVESGAKAAGSYQINFNASQLPSGMYFYQLQTREFTSTQKMLLIK